MSITRRGAAYLSQEAPYNRQQVGVACTAPPLATQGTRIGTDDLRSILARIQGIRHACDLDLLLFFYRHPRALLTAERLVAILGYDREQVAKSLDGLIEAGLLTRSQNPSHAARLYVLELGGVHGAPLTALLEIAATREGRRELLRLLQPGPNHATRAGVQRASLAKVA